jgi:hypothetical protein
MVCRPAAEAPLTVWMMLARASDLPRNVKQDHLRAHALAGTTAVERAAVKRRAVVERTASGGAAAAQVVR